MSMFSVSNGIWLDRKLQEMEDRADRSDKLEILEWLDNELMENSRLFAYLVKVDKLGYLRALAKAKTLFRELYREFDFNKMIDGNLEKQGWRAINSEFVEVIDDIYYSEIRPNATNRVDLKLDRYNALRDELNNRAKKDKLFTEDDAKEMFGITKSEMFEKIERNEIIWAFDLENNVWRVAKVENYKKHIQTGRVRVDFPIAS